MINKIAMSALWELITLVIYVILKMVKHSVKIVLC